MVKTSLKPSPISCENYGQELTINCDLIFQVLVYKDLNYLQLLFSRHGLVGLAQTCLLSYEMRRTRLQAHIIVFCQS